MRNVIIAAIAVVSTTANAGIFATAGIKNDWRGKTILTTEPCQLDVSKFPLGLKQEDMKRVFYMTGDGMTGDGCWKHEHGSVVLAWPNENVLRRWPIGNFKLTNQGW